jgi:hypothetical protein
MKLLYDKKDFVILANLSIVNGIINSPFPDNIIHKTTCLAL